MSFQNGADRRSISMAEAYRALFSSGAAWVMMGAMAAGFASPAIAQQTSDSAPEGGLSDIVVTAQRRAEPLQKAAIAVTAVTGDALRSASVTQPEQLANLLPSIKVTPTGGTNNNVYIRGVGTTAANSFAENAVGVNLDGVYIGRPSGLSGLLYDLDRIEVLKGPQGTLYGRNASGGVVNVVTRKASLSGYSGTASIEYGNYDSKKLQAAVNLPLSQTLAVRLAGQYVDRDGYLSDGYDDEKAYGGRVNVLWQPISDFRVELTADYEHQGGNGGGGVLSPRNAADTVTPRLSERVGGSDPRSVAALTSLYGPIVTSGTILPPRGDGYVNGETYGVSMTISADTGFGTLTFIPAYREIKPRFLSYRTGFYALNDETARQTSGEVRFASPEERRFQYVVGGYYYFLTQEFINYYVQGNSIGTRLQGHTTTESAAAFGQVRYSITDTLRLVGGARYTHEVKVRNALSGSRAPLLPNAPLTSVVGRKAFDNTSYRAGIEYDAAPRSLVYATVATGFKSGGFYTGVGDATYRPERLTAYTLGTKNRFLNNRVGLNLEAFYWKYRDQQIAYIGPVQTGPGVYGAAGLVANIGQARMYGLDAELRVQLSRADSFSATGQYLNSKYTRFQFLTLSLTGAPLATACANTPSSALPIAAPAKLFQLDCAGQTAINAPKWSSVLSYEHVFDLPGDMQLVGHLGTRIETGRFLNVEYLPGERQKGFHKSNASLTLKGGQGRWSLTGFIDNLENRTTINQATVRPVANAIYVGLDAPRTYGLRASVDF
jgi:iron complex outermembrane receptor protein